MIHKSQTLGGLLAAIGSFILCVSLGAGPIAGPASQQTPPDNTKKNREVSSPTADQQKMNAADRAITQKIRKAIIEDKSLSTYAHNVKIITQNGKVTLRGPVRSDDEKNSIEAKAADVVGKDNVTSELEVAPPK